ncbi:hypothetical protein O181_105530 [Austropuccinia psidii MF-1]|uniref:RRM domain-containing protein n=1 Tax=Austropuccinia psidii MF-1 TaxID=1389203 RepID=A0A9Q3JLU0_9BASI|nr:hypothetical protein [Austropuccinia psidii MF-1]
MINHSKSSHHSNLENFNTIKVENVSLNVSKDMLLNFFSSTSKVIEIYQSNHQNLSNETRQFYVCFQDSQTANDVLNNLNGIFLDGHKLLLELVDNNLIPPNIINPSISSLNPRHRKLHHLNDSKQNDKPLLSNSRLFNRLSENNLVSSHSKSETGFSSLKNRNLIKPEIINDSINENKNCNLYVLNLSLDITNESLKSIMKEFGQVKHVCVLATLDNAGRRRAFVDMTTPEEARAIVQNLHGKKVQGYELNITYAFVQRSGGPGISLDNNNLSNDQKRNPHFQINPKSSTFRKLDEIVKNHPIRKSASMPVSRTNSLINLPLINSNSILNLYSDLPKTKLDNLNSKENIILSPPHSSLSSSQGLSESSNSILLNSTQNQIKNSSYSTLDIENNSNHWSISVSNVSPVACIDSDDLFKFFKNHGIITLKSAKLNLDIQTGMSLGSGHLNFNSLQDCENAFDLLSNKDILLDGTKIHFKKALHEKLILSPKLSSSYLLPSTNSTSPFPNLSSSISCSTSTNSSRNPLTELCGDRLV